MLCSTLEACLNCGAPVKPISSIAAGNRTAAWTVLVSPRGVAEYLNKRISPIGACLVCHVCLPCTGARLAISPAVVVTLTEVQVVAALPHAFVISESAALQKSQVQCNSISLHSSWAPDPWIWLKPHLVVSNLDIHSASLTRAVNGMRLPLCL